MNAKNYQEDLSHIRSMMERSSRFISLSGLSGIVAGLIALCGGFWVYYLFKRAGFDYFGGDQVIFTREIINELVIVAVLVLLSALFFGYIFTARKSRRNNLRIWDATTKKLLFNFAVPLITGGVFCLGLLYHHLFVFLPAATLIFYGLALVSAEKYTLTDVKYLGYLEVILGLISFFLPGWGLLFWMIGFGVLHIIYGAVMYNKYDR